MSKIIKHTDLTGEEPGPRADVRLPLEGIGFEAQLTPWVSFKLHARTLTKSPLNAAVTAALVAVAGCVCAGLSAAIGAPAWLAIAMIIVPGIFYFLAQFLTMK